MTKRIGITGGIASGKSTVGRLLQAWGYPVIDADEVVHELLSKNPDVQERLRHYFGDCVFDAETRTPNRHRLAERIFKNAADKAFMEALLHPLVRQAIQDFFDTHQAQAFALVPLLFEGGTEMLYDEVWCVACSAPIQLERLQAYRGMTLEEAQRRIASQWSLEEKIKRSHRVLWNEGSEDELILQVKNCLKESN
jgi:dephospho-CoA kinase